MVPVATAPTVYGIETELLHQLLLLPIPRVATAPTVYGIETRCYYHRRRKCFRLQQHLPFTVLKQYIRLFSDDEDIALQQHLPFTVLKP